MGFWGFKEFYILLRVKLTAIGIKLLNMTPMGFNLVSVDTFTIWKIVCRANAQIISWILHTVLCIMQMVAKAVSSAEKSN